VEWFKAAHDKTARDGTPDERFLLADDKTHLLYIMCLLRSIVVMI
jgi:hypothetical protein